MNALNTDTVNLHVTGMTCAACAARIERKLNKIDGVEATVNYATERATIRRVGEPGGELQIEPSDEWVDSLIATIEATGYGANLPAEDDGSSNADRLVDLRRRLFVAVALGLPVMLMSMIPALQFDGWQWVALVLATPVATWAAWPFHRAMLLNLRHRQATMDTLVSVGVIAAYLWSVWALLFTSAGDIGMRMSMQLGGSETGSHAGMNAPPHLYFEVASTVVAFILAGRYFEARAKQRAGNALRALLDLGAKEVNRLDDDGVEHRVPIASLRVGDRFVVRPGEQIATDGTVMAGESSVDRALVTGESVPVNVKPGDAVTGATLNTYGRLIVVADKVGADTQLAQMARLVENAQSGKAPVQRLADRVAGVFVPIVIGLAVVTLVGWLIATGDVQRSFAAGVAVLIIACPCALGLATPTALLVGTGRGAQMGIVIKGPEILEQTRKVDTIVLDKTGTITTGVMSLVKVDTSDGITRADALRIAGAIEASSEHPIGRAISDAAVTELGTLPAVDEFRNEPGVGVSASLDDVRYHVGRSTTSAMGSENGAGQTLVALRREGDVLATFTVADSIRPTSVAAIQWFKRLGLTPILLTGDATATARRVAAEVDIDEVRAEVMPADKVATVKQLQETGATVAMVGDGVNDAAALVQADLGLSMGAGTDVAIAASDLTLVRNDLTAAVDAIRLSRRTLATIKGNLFWAFAYNVLAIPIAMSGRLSPVIAGMAMAFSSVFVVANSLRLRGFRSIND